jgi:hypothetical protein
MGKYVHQQFSRRPRWSKTNFECGAFRLQPVFLSFEISWMDLWRLLHKMWCNWMATNKHISGMINYFRLQLNKYIPRIFSVHVLYRCKITFTEQSTKFVEIYVYVKKTNKMHTPFIIVMSILIIRDDLLKDYRVLKAY